MIYSSNNTLVPEHLREEVNKKILYLVENDLCGRYGVSRNDIFNSFTGKGGLHGLNRKDYASYHAYAAGKKQIEQGQFFTPSDLCGFVMECLRPGPGELIADLSCGTGNFFNHCGFQSNLYGCDIDLPSVKVARYLYPEAHIEHNDTRFYLPKERFDLVVGNPPFNLNLEWHRETLPSQMVFLLKAASVLKPGGILAAIVPLAFLNDEFMDRGQIELACKDLNFNFQIRLDDKAFASQGVATFSTKLMIWQKKSKYLEAKLYQPLVHDFGSATAIHDRMVAPLKIAKEKERTRIYLEMRKDGQYRKAFIENTQKLLFDIKRHPRLITRYGQCLELVNRYLTQERPRDMKFDEWEKARLKSAQVIAHLEGVVSNQHAFKKDQIRLVKTNNGLYLKAYSMKSKDALRKAQGPTNADFIDLVPSGHYPFQDPAYKGLVRRKHADYILHNTKIAALQPPQTVLDFVESFSLFDSQLNEFIRPNARQKADIAQLLSKRCGILNWQQGSGKTLAGIMYFQYLMKHRPLRNVFIVSTSLAIKSTWSDYLSRYGLPFVCPTRLPEVAAIEPGQIVLLTHHILTKCKRQLRRLLKLRAKKVLLVVDESDEFTNDKSIRTRAALALFRKVRHVLLTTGTTTRNNIAEFYAQLSLVYNNSYNMLCQCPEIHRYNAKEECLENHRNSHYRRPFPAQGGAELFKECFNPHKATVFGIHKHNQDVLNAAALVDIIERTVITRTFEQVVGKQLYSAKTLKIQQGAPEKQLYSKILEDLVNMYYYFKRCDNHRKDSMLRLIRQIKLLIKAASLPHTFSEYGSTKPPEKYNAILNLVGGHQDQKIAIGTIHKQAAHYYRRQLTNDLGGRPIFWVTGERGIAQRKQVVDGFQATENGVLICTQQSLKSSINIESCDIAIIESLQWNIPRISQFFFRFIRYNSLRQKQIYFVTYEGTIEQNLLALLMAKEKVNQFVQLCDKVSEAALFEKFGIDGSLISSLIEKEVDEDGKMRLTWGRQKVA